MPVSPRPYLLYLVHRVPHPPDKGDRIRSYHLLRHLARQAAVHLACLADEPVSPETTAALEGLCERVTFAPLDRCWRWVRAARSLTLGRTVTEGAFASPALGRTLRAWAKETRYSAILASASSLAPYLQLEGLQNVPAVVDLMDVDSQKWFDYAATSRGLRAWLYRIEGRRLRRLEQGLARSCRALTLVSPAEVGLFKEFCTNGVVQSVPNGVDLDYFQPMGEATGPSCVFVGALDYRPNIDAVCWFCEHVWPRIRALRPNAEFLIVGRRPSAALAKLARQAGVNLIGQVSDVRPHVGRAAVVVVPLRIARGVQNKVLEAMAMAKATIVSPQALAGIQAVPGRHLLQASTPEEWTEQVLRVWDDPGLRQRLSVAARGFVEQRHQWDTCLAPMASLLGLNTGEPSAAEQALELVTL